MLISFLHTAAEVGIVLAVAHILAMWFARTPLGAALSFVYGT